MEIRYSKTIAAISMSIITFIFTMLPLLLVKRYENRDGAQQNRVLSFLSCFGGGVFLGTCLLHLFPDVKDQMDLIFETLYIHSTFPMAEFLLGFGFLFILVVDQIVQNFASPTEIHAFSHQHSHTQEDSYQNYAINQSMSDPYIENSHSIHSGLAKSEDNLIDPHSTEVFHQDQSSHLVSHSHTNKDSYQNYGAINESMPVLFIENSHSIHPEGPPVSDDPQSTDVLFVQDFPSQDQSSVLRSLFLLFALSLHSVFEGLAIGLQSSTEQVLRILFAVLVHKCIVAFTLGLSLTNSKLNAFNIVKASIFFSLTSPFGIVVGLVVGDFVTGIPMMVTAGVLKGLAAGTFLYVTFFEVLPHELNNSENRLIKLGCIILGFSIISFLLVFLPD